MLRAAFKGEPVETSLAGWTPLGNYELQRKRERMPLAQPSGGFAMSCPICGKETVQTLPPVLFETLRRRRSGPLAERRLCDPGRGRDPARRGRPRPGRADPALTPFLRPAGRAGIDFTPGLFHTERVRFTGPSTGWKSDQRQARIPLVPMQDARVAQG